MEYSSAEFVLVRHGQTVWNAAKRIQGHTDTELSDAGREQARKVARRLETEAFDFLYSSDLKRARHTADPFAALAELDVFCDERLREWNLGDFEGLTVEDAKNRFSDAYRRYRSFDPDSRVPGGESFLEFDHRIIDFFVEKARAHHGSKILVYTHGGGINVVLRHVLGIPMTSREKFFIPNASVTRVKLSLENSATVWDLVASDVDLLHPKVNVAEPGGVV